MKPVEAGFFSFTEVLDGEHRSYNEWHMLDHMPEQYALDGIAWGQRWVSTPACRAARVVSSAPLDAIHYVTLYLMTDPLEQTLTEFSALGRHLAAIDRFHRHRKSHLSGPFPVGAMWAAPQALVGASVVPMRPCRGVYVVVAADPSPGSVVLDMPGVAGVWAFADAERRITVAWLDDDPVEVAAASGARLLDACAPGGSVEFAGPFETITPWRWDWFDGI